MGYSFLFKSAFSFFPIEVFAKTMAKRMIGMESKVCAHLLWTA